MISHELGRIENGRYIWKALMEGEFDRALWFDQELGFWLKMIEGAPEGLALLYEKKARLCTLHWIQRELES